MPLDNIQFDIVEPNYKIKMTSKLNSKSDNRTYYNYRNNSHKSRIGYIDVGDGCWRPNVLVTRFGCW